MRQDINFFDSLVSKDPKCDCVNPWLSNNPLKANPRDVADRNSKLKKKKKMSVINRDTLT